MSVKLSRELAKLPIEKYRLPKDGRKWQAVARNRMMLADFSALTAMEMVRASFPVSPQWRRSLGGPNRKRITCWPT